VGLGGAQEEVAHGVIAGETLQAQHGVEDVIGPQPLAMGEALRSDDDGHQERRERVGQRDGVVGGRFDEGQAPLHLPGKADRPQKGDETGQPTKGRGGLGRFIQNELVAAKERGDLGAGRFVRGRAGLFKHQSSCPQPLESFK